MKQYCPNCYHPVPKKANFCSECGQKNSNIKISMRILLLKLWNTTFHLEGKFLRTCWQLFIPGKVTQEFFNGKQSRYPHPLRMFAVVMFFFLFAINMMLKKEKEEDPGSFFKISTTVDTKQGVSIKEQNSMIDYERMKQQVMVHDLLEDFKNLPIALQTPESQKAIDSLFRKNNLLPGVSVGSLADSLGGSFDTININFFAGRELKVSTLDLVRYEPDEIIRRYGITDWILKLLLRQTIKSYKNPEGFVHAYIGSLTWAILALVALISTLLSLLYWKQKRFYVEHFIFLLHFHTGVMLALLIVSLGKILDVWGMPMFGLIFIWATVFMYFAMRRFYGQGRGKTILKWLIFGCFYYAGFIILFTMGTILVFAIY